MDTDNFQDTLTQWYSSELGRLVFEAEHYQLDQLLPDYFGYHLLQLGAPFQTGWLEHSPIRHQVCLSSKTEPVVETVSCFNGALDALPFEPNSVDVLILPHTLEFCDQPELVLQEAIQALIPEGYLIILGFNSNSLWGIKRLFDQKGMPWSGAFHSVGRVRRWLKKSHCEIDHFKTFLFGLPVVNKKRKGWLNFLETLGRACWPSHGGLYVISAKKQVSMMTPIKSKWQTLKFLRKKRVVAPTVRNVSHHEKS